MLSWVGRFRRWWQHRSEGQKRRRALATLAGATEPLQGLVLIEKADLGLGTGYTTLRALEDEGLLRSDPGIRPTGTPCRYYRITEQGRGWLDQKRHEEQAG